MDKMLWLKNKCISTYMHIIHIEHVGRGWNSLEWKLSVAIAVDIA